MGWDLTLGTAPYEDFDGSTPGLVNFRRGQPGYGSVYADFAVASLGKNIPEVDGPVFDHLEVPLQSGRVRTRRIGRGKVTVRVNIDDMTGEEWLALQQVLRADRLLMFDPPYDDTTIWAANFAASDPGGGVALIGESGSSQLSRRLSSELVPFPTSGNQALRAVGGAKIVPGMIGNAILLESATDSEVVDANPTWVAAANAEVVAGLLSNLEGVGGFHVYATGSGSDYVSLSSSGGTISALTNGQPYTATVWMRGTGAAQLSAVHNSGGTIATGDVVTLDPRVWQRIRVTWTQVGTSIELRITTTSQGYMGQVAGPQVENKLHPTSWVGTGAPSTADGLAISDNIPLGAVTFVFWHKHVADSGTRYFWSATESATDYYIRIDSSGQYQVVLAGTAGSINAASGASDGAWTQLVVVQSMGAGAAITEVYENGALVDSQSHTTTSFGPMRLANPSYIGSDRGLASPSQIGLDAPLDSVRIDGRAWTAAEVANDYYKRIAGGSGTNEGGGAGLQAFLEQTQGRLFRVRGGPKGFRNVDVDDVVGSLVLEQVDFIECACPSDL